MTKTQLKDIAKESVLASRIEVLKVADIKSEEYDLSADDREYMLGMVDIYLTHLRRYMGR